VIFGFAETSFDPLFACVASEHAAKNSTITNAIHDVVFVIIAMITLSFII
jgi:hypothetical protein